MSTTRKLTSTNAVNERYLQTTCPMQYAMEQIGGRWKLMLLWYINVGVNHFSTLRRHIPSVTIKVLTQQLRELESDGLIERTVVSSRPLHVTYALTPSGVRLVPILTALNEWASQAQRSTAACSAAHEAS